MSLFDFNYIWGLITGCLLCFIIRFIFNGLYNIFVEKKEFKRWVVDRMNSFEKELWNLKSNVEHHDFIIKDLEKKEEKK
jgi:hypothetical protein